MSRFLLQQYFIRTDFRAYLFSRIRGKIVRYDDKIYEVKYNSLV